MESANLHQQHQLQPPQLVPSSTSPSTYGAAAAASPNAWTQNFTLSNVRQKNETSNPPLNSLMIQDLGFHWNSNNAVSIPNHDQQIGKIKQELTDSSPKISEMLNSTSSSINHEDSHLSASTNYIKDDQKYMSDLSEKLLLKTLSSGFPINGHQFSPSQIYSTSSYGSSASRGNFCQIYPSVNISNLNRSPPPISSPASFDINLQALDHLTTSFGQACHDHSLGIYKDTDVSYNGLDRMHHSSFMPSCNPSKISSAFTTNEISEAKRPNNSLIEPKAAQVAIKKSRLESRASCPPFKVRKEKLGDRIATLQQLVAPFGKTDTASVLMEAIGYIKFLQNQVETLSVPYMKSSRNKNSRTTQAGSTVEEGNDEPKKDLRSRGLCLVPLSCMSYVTSDGGGGGGGGIWPPPNFGGGT